MRLLEIHWLWEPDRHAYRSLAVTRTAGCYADRCRLGVLAFLAKGDGRREPGVRTRREPQKRRGTNARTASCLNLHVLNLPIRQPLAVNPPLEELAIIAAGVGFEFGAIILCLQHAPAILRNEHSCEIEERRLAELRFDHPEGLRAAIVRAREQVEQLLVLREVLRRGEHLDRCGSRSTSRRCGSSRG